MDFEHMKVEIIRQVLVRQGVIPDNKSLSLSKEVLVKN